MQEESTLQAVLLDRDGVINEEINLLSRPEQLRLIEGAAEGIVRFNRRGIWVLVLTNQPVVARNLCSEAELQEIHRQLRVLLWDAAQAQLDRIYYCPHHPERFHADANFMYRKPCRCRKPGTGMFEMALRDFRLTPEQCVVVGDSTRDILAGQRMGMRTILVQSGYGGKDGQYDVEPDLVLPNLAAAAHHLLRPCGAVEPSMRHRW
jgi:histidinol-phosphate phosphatase family protein